MPSKKMALFVFGFVLTLVLLFGGGFLGFQKLTKDFVKLKEVQTLTNKILSEGTVLPEDYYSSLYLNVDKPETISGKLTLTALPEGEEASQGLIYLNPPSSTLDATLFGVAVGEEEKLRINSEGDIKTTGNLTAASLSGSAKNLTNLDASKILTGILSPEVISGKYANITGLGTITEGTWQGKEIEDEYVSDQITASRYLLLKGGIVTGPLILQGSVESESDLTVAGLLTAKGTIKITPQDKTPSSPSEGILYYNKTNNNLYLYSNGYWVDLTQQGQWTDTGDYLYPNNAGTTFQISNQGDLIIPGTITQTGGQIAFSGNVDAQSGLDITQGSLTVGGTKFIVDPATGEITIEGNIFSTGDIATIDNITTTGNLIIGGDLTVSGAQTYSGAASFTADSPNPALSVRQDGTGDIVNFKDGAITVFKIANGGDVTMTGDFTVSGSSVTLPAGSIDKSELADAAKTKTGPTLIVAASNSNDTTRADYVCDGTGGTDDATTIESTIQALPSAGGTVLLLEGTYYIESSIDIKSAGGVALSNVSLIGSGRGTVIQKAANCGAITVGDGGTTAVEGIVIADLQINGVKASYTGNGIYFNQDISQSRIQNTWVHDCDGEGIYLGGALGKENTYNLIEENDIRSNASGFYLEDSSYNNITDNAVQGNTDYGVYLVSSSQNIISGNKTEGNGWGGEIALESCDNNTISGNILQGGDKDGIYIRESINNTVTGNTIQGNDGSGIVLLNIATTNTITGNTIQGNTLDGISITGSSNNNVVAGNKIDNNGGSGNYDGIEITGDSDNNLISSNDITDTDGTGYAIDIQFANCGNNYLVGNRYSGTGADSINDAGTGTTIQHRDQFEVGSTLTTADALNINYNPASGTYSAASITYGTGGGTGTALTVTQSGTGNIVEFKDASATKLALDASGNLTLTSGNLTTAFGGFGRYENYLTYSEELDNAAWTATGLSVTADQTASPYGTTTADQITDDATPGGTLKQTEIEADATETWTFSIWIKDNDTTGNISIEIEDNDSGSTSLTIDPPAEWQRYSVSHTGAASATEMYVVINHDSTASNSFYAWGAQLEEQTEEGVYVRTLASEISTTTRGSVGTPAGPTLIVAAADSKNVGRADYVCGGTNDEVEIESAIGALPAAGGVVYLLEGTYNIGSDITVTKSNVALIGSGKATILKRAWNETVANTSGIITVGDGTNPYEGILISQLQIDGDKASFTSNKNYAIFFKQRISRSQIKGSWIYNSAGTGIYLYANAAANSNSNNTIEGNEVKENDVGIELDYCSSNTITGNTVQANTDDAIGIYNSSQNVIIGNNLLGNGGTGVSVWGTVADPSDSNTVSGNNIQQSGCYGIQISNGSYNSIVSNNVQSGEDYGIYVYGLNNSVTGNIVEDNQSIGIYSNGDLNVIANNVVKGNGWYGIHVYNSYNSITGNTLAENSGEAISIESGANHNSITGNTIGTSPWSGIWVESDYNVVTGNKLHNTAGTGVEPGIYISGDFNLVSSNNITDTAGTGYAIEVYGSQNYLVGNRYSGTGADSINDAGTGTTIQHRDWFEIESTLTTADALNINYNPASGTYSAASITYGAGGGTGTALTVTQSGTGNIVEFKDGGTAMFIIKEKGQIVLNPSTTQTLAAADAISANATHIKVAGSGGAVILTSTPTIADGDEGQVLIVRGTNDVNTIAVQDQGTLANSNLEIGAASRTLGNRDVLVLMFDGADWIEVSFSDN